jgi:hypothetical protein
LSTHVQDRDRIICGSISSDERELLRFHGRAIEMRTAGTTRGSKFDLKSHHAADILSRQWSSEDN